MIGASRLYYEEKTAFEHAASRAGRLHTPAGVFDVPEVSPSLRTLTDWKAVQLNIEHGLQVRVISPYASEADSFGPEFADFFWPTQTRLIPTSVPSPLVIADIESEALSFNCKARENYKRLDKPMGKSGRNEAMELLLSTSGRTDAGLRTQEAHAAWNQMLEEYGPGLLMDWTKQHLTAVGSDVLSVPTPIIKKEAGSVENALRIGKLLLPIAQRSTEFKMHGIHLLLSDGLFDVSSRATKARSALEKGIASWAMDYTTRDLFLSMKIDDSGTILNDRERGRIARRHLSDLLVNLQQSVRLSNGVLVAFNVGNWALGYLDSGADIAGVRLTGRPIIDRLWAGRKGETHELDVPPITSLRSMADEPYEVVKEHYEQNDQAFPVPSCMDPEPYWGFSPRDQWKYVARAKCGVFVSVGKEYREAAEDPSKPLRESLASRINDSGMRQELTDLSPSVRGEGN
jgi:hypothetical protein